MDDAVPDRPEADAADVPVSPGQQLAQKGFVRKRRVFRPAAIVRHLASDAGHEMGRNADPLVRNGQHDFTRTLIVSRTARRDRAHALRPSRPAAALLCVIGATNVHVRS